MMLSTVNCATSCVPSFVFTMVFGCPCKPLRYSLGPYLSRSSNLNSTFRLALSHVEVVIQCLLSLLLRKFSTTFVFEALNDVVHCELCNILCSELRFHNGLRLSVQTSPIQPWSQSVTAFQLELNLPEPHISFPLTKFFCRYRPWNCGTCSSSLRSIAPDIAEDLSSATSVK